MFIPLWMIEVHGIGALIVLFFMYRLLRVGIAVDVYRGSWFDVFGGIVVMIVWSLTWEISFPLLLAAWIGDYR